MFFDFFYRLRSLGVPTGTGELLDLLKALSGYGDRGIVISPERFYYISRACLVRDERFFDAFDRAFAEIFKHALREGDAFRRALEEWLRSATERRSAARADQAPLYDPDQLWKELESRLAEQTERHDGGAKWVGTGGVSPFGHSGENPRGVRIGGQGGGRSAIDVLEARRYREYSDDERINVRGYTIALRKLKDLRREGRPEFDLRESIRRTADSGGDPEIVFERSRKNRMTLLLLTDVGGSMTGHARSVSRLFSAASKMQHFRKFQHYYFHNAVYEHVFEDAAFRKPVPIEDIYKQYDSETRLILAGDACMNPYELFDKRHAFFEYYYRARNQEEAASHRVPSAYERLRDLVRHYPHSVWLNPEPRRSWDHETIAAVGDEISMFPLTIGGLRGAVKHLMHQ
ncbi:MAG: VWA domain-containing protein [Spirochaetia bacterium]|nr:VWA domain-containing protein [Spirochaetia bacterium]